MIARLARETQAALNLPDVKAKLLDLNLVAHASTPEQLGQQLASEIKRWDEVITRAKIAKQ